ncbi:MAG: M20/M25/M40 family metallo-hydrolase, partial [Microbacteriaceae bacterium]
MAIDLEALYVDLHTNPELSFQEHRTADLLASHLRALGFAVTEGVGKTGVLGVLRNGEGPCLWLRADMDALPVQEQGEHSHASRATGIDESGETVPVMHACGHDMHMTAMVGAAERLSLQRDTWAGTVVIVFQPAEELGAGARAML